MPWHSWPTCLWKVGSNQISRKEQPASHCGARRSISARTARASMSGAPKISSGRVVPLPSLKRRAFEHDRAGIVARHADVGRVGAGVDPDAVVGPAEARAVVGLPPFHRDDAIIDVQLEVIDEPMAELAQRQAVAHRDRAGADEAFPAGPERQPLDRAAGGIGPVEHPHRLAVLGRGFEHVEQGRDEGVDAAAEVLEVDQHRVEARHHLAGRAADLAVEAEHRDAEDADRYNRGSRPYCPACRPSGHAAGRRRR